MKFSTKTILAWLCIVLLLSGCTAAPATVTTTTEPTTQVTTTVPATTLPDTDPAIVYEAAIGVLEDADAASYTLDYSLDFTVGTQRFTSVSHQEILLQDKNSEQPKVQLTENMHFGDGAYETDITEIYVDGILFTTIYDSNFTGAVDTEFYLSQLTPVIMFDAANFQTVQWLNETTIGFSDATACEDWLCSELAELISAKATATIGDDGALTHATYQVSYRRGGMTVTEELVQTFSTPKAEIISAPADTSAYTTVSNPEAFQWIEQGFGLMLQSGTLTTSSLSNTVSQAAGYMMNQQVTVNAYDMGGNDLIKVEQNIYRADHTGASSKENMTERFENGVYTYSYNGSAYETNSVVTVHTVRQYVQELLIDQVIDLSYIEDITYDILDSAVLITYTCSEALAEHYRQELSLSLFQSETFLDDMASAYETLTMECYIALDINTMLPTAAGIHYLGTHTIQGHTYNLSKQIDQSLNLSSLSAYEAITGKHAPEEEPEEKATPLFYKVTGSNGQQMWLLGTIHVGDNKTGYLPQEIYDALQSSDALAVEFDTEAFEEAIEEDEQLQNIVSNAYYYSDGKAAKEHASDKELYAYAEKMMKASGNYNVNTPYLKLSMWSSAIDDFHLNLGYKLSSEKGVDTRLLKLAKAQGLPIYDIESGEFQLMMLTGWSDPLQESILAGSVYTNSFGYNASLDELYDLWCQGDEAALIQALTEDTSDYSAEDLKLYNEYNKAMSTDRNAGMLDVAIEYLESDETVFYAVGLAHLLVEDGLVNTLRAAGYTVELVSFS